MMGVMWMDWGKLIDDLDEDEEKGFCRSSRLLLC
jgi:hypothetical protein